MPARESPEGYNYIQILDFRPGIADVPSSNYPPGTAQRSGTFRCIANRSGALEPLPKRQTPFTMPHEGTTPNYIIGVYIPPYGILPTSGVYNPNIFPVHQMFVGTERHESGNYYVKVRRARRFEPPGTAFDTIKSVTGPIATTGTTPWAPKPTGMGFSATRSKRDDWRKPGCAVTIMLYSQGFLGAFLSEFPDDQNQTSLTPYDIFTATVAVPGLFMLNMTCHQGRAIVELAEADNQGTGAITFMGENVIWSQFNDVTTANWLSNTIDPETGTLSHPAVFVPENPSGFSFMASMSANELFAVKTGQGGLYVTGNLGDSTTAASPSVVSLPMVTGTDIAQIPAINTLGVCYGSRQSGVWLWSHGDTSRLISPQLAEGFWTIPSSIAPLDDWGGISYSFANWNEWVVTPHNWVYDTQSGGWWRLEDDSVAKFRFTTGRWNLLYCGENSYTDTYDTPISFFDRNGPFSPSYSWQSQPLWETIDTLVDIREITLRVRGSGQVTVTATGETSSSSVTFTGISAILPVLLRQPIRVQDANIAIKIESSGSVVAPTVYECNIAFVGVQRERITY